MIPMPSLVRAACAGLAALLLASCGGGTQVEAFRPTRLIVFGDETSLLVDAANDANARKYTVNALKDDKVTLDCVLNPIWVQSLSNAFGLTFKECNPNQVATPNALMYAVADARSAAIATQIAAHTSGFGSKDLVTILAGAHDILDQYDAVKSGATEAQAVAVLEAAGAALAGQVNSVATRGGKVLISLVPDMGLTPFAVAENTATPGRAALLTRLTSAFNQKLRLNIINDGRMIGLLLTEELVQAIAKGIATGSTFINSTAAACDATKAATVLECTTETLVTGATSSNYLWADDRHLSAGGHLALGQAAVSRANGNPF